ncbi:hypothetical protein [Kitasatospora sp. NPDC057198]|uniref:tetratricopeptide repeat protein n=1 Tax=Kitasatospora sp. NPDC057198 TaxID=3346046 RepID=UPI0036307158
MNVDDFDHRVRTESGCVPPDLVRRLLELGHTAVVREQAGRGEWFCAREWARWLERHGRPDEALAVLEPYLALNWWPAAEAAVELLEGRGRVEEAVALARPYAEGGDQLVLRSFARLLTRHGRADEAFALLLPHLSEWFLAGPLVEAAEAAGLAEEAADLLAARIAAAPPETGDVWGPDGRSGGVEPRNAVELLAGIRERQGRVAEAIALLRTRQDTSVGNRDALADLLARHGRIEELRAYAEADGYGHGLQRLAEVLEERGDVDGAIEAYRRTEVFRRHVPVLLAHLLARHGRGEEAIELAYRCAERSGGEDCDLDLLATLCLDLGRPGHGLDLLDALRERRGGAEHWEQYWMRLPLMAACGRIDEAVERSRAHPEGDTWYAPGQVARMLADAGRTEEAVALLRVAPDPDWNRRDLGGYLVELGRIEEALAVLQHYEPPQPSEPLEPTGGFEHPPF